MKRIGLMTWHHSENYGTAFQAYALKTLIENQGCHVDLIDYKRLGMSPLDIPHYGHLLCEKFLYVLNKIKKRNKLFFKFKEETFGRFYKDRFTYTKGCLFNQDFHELNNQYDGFVCGSDQIWGPNWYDGRYFLDFVTDTRKLISYAPSLGVSSIPNPHVKDMMRADISRFDHLSIREKSGCETVKKMVGRIDVYNVLDPVLMLDINHWKHLEEPLETKSKEYALVFFLANNTSNIELSIRDAHRRGKEPIVMHCTQTEDTPYANIQELTPGQLLYCIHNASYIYTDSFHVSVLSIIFHRQFITFKKNAGGKKTTQYERITDLLECLQINGGKYENDASFNLIIDYKKVDTILEEKREESLDYLRKALNSISVETNKVDNNEICNKVSECEGEVTEVFKQYLSTIKYKKKGKFIRYCQFALTPKCYRCKYLKSNIITDGRKPLFYEDLQNRLKLKKSVYLKYYLPFYPLYILRKIRHS